MPMIEDALRSYSTFEDRTTDPDTPDAGSGLVYVKNGAVHTKDSAATVIEYGPGSSLGDLTHIQTITLGSTGPILFTAIPATFRHLLLVVKGRSARTGNATDAWVCRVGDGSLDTGNNYTFGQNVRGTNTANAQHAGTAQFQMQDNGLPAGNADADRFARLTMWFHSYTDTARRDVMSFNHAFATGSVYNSAMMSGQWLNTTDPIERIQVTGFNADLVAVSSGTLYGVA